MLRLSDEQWDRIKGHFPEENIPESRPGRKPVPTRQVLEAALWILNTGAQWHMLPQSYPNYKTVHRRFQQWCEQQVLREVLTDLANALREQGDIDEREAFIDATFASAKGGGDAIGPTKRGKGVKIMAIVDRHGLPLSVSTHAANHHDRCAWLKHHALANFCPHSLTELKTTARSKLCSGQRRQSIFTACRKQAKLW
jgi:transposase